MLRPWSKTIHWPKALKTRSFYSMIIPLISNHPCNDSFFLFFQLIPNCRCHHAQHKVSYKTEKYYLWPKLEQIACGNQWPTFYFPSKLCLRTTHINLKWWVLFADQRRTHSHLLPLNRFLKNDINTSNEERRTSYGLMSGRLRIEFRACKAEVNIVASPLLEYQDKLGFLFYWSKLYMRMCSGFGASG